MSPASTTALDGPPSSSTVMATPPVLIRARISTIAAKTIDPRTIAKVIVLSKLSTTTRAIATRKRRTLPRIANKASSGFMLRELFEVFYEAMIWSGVGGRSYSLYPRRN
jgi:hypothetical protein